MTTVNVWWSSRRPGVAMSAAQMIGKAVRGPGHQQPNGYVPQVRGVLRAVDGDEGLVEEGQSLRRTRCPLVSLVLDETTEQALAAEDGPGGSLHWAQVPDAGGTRLVWTSFVSLSAAITAALHYRECPALRHGVAPIVHEARKSKGVRVDVYL